MTFPDFYKKLSTLPDFGNLNGRRERFKKAYIAGLSRVLELAYGEEDVKTVIDRITQEIHDLR